MMQGDSYSILITDAGVNFPKVSKIEFTLGPYTKTYPGEIIYDSDNRLFRFPISQAESLRMIGHQSCQARIKYTDGQVEGMTIGSLEVSPAMSKEVL